MVALGIVEIEMPYSAALTQQHGFLHAGVISTALDSACGYAAFSLMPESASVLTIGATYRHRLGADSNWFLDAGLHYGSGGSKLEDTGPITFEQTESVSAVFGNAGLGYILPLTKKTSIYGSGRLFYSSATATLEVPSGEFEGESFNVYGFEPAAGCSHRMNRLTYFGEFYNQFGWGSGEVGDVTYNSTIKQSCWRGGLLFNF